MRARVAIVTMVVLGLTGVAASSWLFSWLEQDALATVLGLRVANPMDPLLGLSWLLTGAGLAWLRPRNAIGWLLAGIGACQVLGLLAAAYGSMGVFAASPDWPLARWAAVLGSGLWIPGLVPISNVLLALYPDGRLAGRQWAWPVGASILGTAMLTGMAWTAQGAYDDVAPGASPLALGAIPTAVKIGYVGAVLILLVGGTITIWVMSAVRLTRMGPPRRQQLAWLFCVVLAMFSLSLGPLPYWPSLVASSLLPVAIALGVFRYNLLGIELVLRRGLTYGALTMVVFGSYLAVSAALGAGLDGNPLPALMVAVAVAVGLTPLRERLQRAVDRLIYGERRDPIRALNRIGDQVSSTDEEDLLDNVLRSIMAAVRSPGAVVVTKEGRLLASEGNPSPGPSFGLAVAGRDVGVLQVANRASVETYGAGDVRLLQTLAPQLAVVVHALDLAEALHVERDRVVAATITERERMRRDLHDGLGPSLSGVALGLVAVEDALNRADTTWAVEMVGRLRPEVAAAVGEVRRIIDNLRPASLDEGRLDGAVRRRAAAAGFPVDLTVTNLPTLRPDVETAAYRIAAEALANIGKHARATRAWVELSAQEGVLHLEVTDNGRGFLLPTATPTDGLGMTSMRHRAEQLGGTFDIMTGHQGTTVTATLPLDAI